MDDVQVADPPRSVGPTEGEVVVPGLDRLDGALGAEGALGSPAVGLRGPDDVEGDEQGLDPVEAAASDGVVREARPLVEGRDHRGNVLRRTAAPPREEGDLLNRRFEPRGVH